MATDEWPGDRPATDEGPGDRPANDTAGDEAVVRGDWTGWRNVGAAVATAVAAATGSEVTDMEPLAYSVDTDALDALLTDSRGEGSVTVSFRYEGVDVRVTSDGEIRVRLPADE
ncbi:HalOD1 output domain-containing protein [Halosimplex pelagicum]|uniref:Halobacterial output domain-containing protein n=1 Tax=Halosimplex pelagicum TaxID=869886 RepID=A0A7D5SUU1_9EURY|nr:HalOD1 output domain-containing protein [Halosimplex pelagicum]QLH81667.1 hypothetical protein HZS54_08530 [Halosimplex pelagicum]